MPSVVVPQSASVAIFLETLQLSPRLRLDRRPKTRRHTAPARSQNLTTAFTCRILGSLALETVPKAADVNEVFGFIQRTKLNGLLASNSCRRFIGPNVCIF